MQQKDTEKEMNFFQALNNLPEVLQKKVIKQIVASILIALICFGIFFLVKTWQITIGLLLALYVAYVGFNIVWKYTDGKIVCEEMTCIKASNMVNGNRICVILKHNNEDLSKDRAGGKEATQKYYIAAPKNDLKFITSGTVMNIYYDNNRPMDIMAWEIVDIR